MMGIPGRIVRATTDEDLEIIDQVVRNYVKLGRQYAEGRFPGVPSK